MKVRLLVAVALSVLGFFVFTAPGVAQKPLPGIKQTAQWKSLNRYVNFLQARRQQPVTGVKKKTFRATLKKRREGADSKVDWIFGRKLTRIAARDDRWEKRQIKKIRRTQKRKVQSLKAQLAGRVDALKAKQAAASARIAARYAPRINRLADKRTRLERKLAKTTKPAKRDVLIRKIRRIQDQINDLVSDRNSEIDNVNSRYQGRIAGVNDLFNARIARAKAGTKRQVRETKTAWKKTFRLQLKAARTRRASQKDLVRALAARGSGYIDGMPEPV